MRISWAVLFCLGFAGLSSSANAETTLAGSWYQTFLSRDFKAVSWGEHCPPVPPPSRKRKKVLYQVTQDGERLTFAKGRQKFGSHRCMSQNPEVRFTSYSKAKRQTRCTSKPNDPRYEEGVYTLKVSGPNRLVYTGKTTYRWALKGNLCEALMLEKRSFERAEPLVEPAEPAPVATVTEAPSDPEAVASSLAPAQARKRSARGKRKAKPGSQAEENVAFRVVAVPESEQGVGAAALDESHQVSTAVSYRGAPLAIGVVIGSIAVALFFLVFWIRRRRDEEGGSSSGGRAGGEELGPGGGQDRVDHGDDRVGCPRCHREYGMEVSYCPFDAEVLKRLPGQPQASQLVDVPRQICVVCYREYAPGRSHCPRDDTPLMPLVGRREVLGLNKSAMPGNVKICPGCSSRYGPKVSFCGKDGLTLEPLN